MKNESASQLEKAETAKREAQEEREAFQHKSDELERQREAFLSSAQSEANAEKQKLLTEARKDYETLRTKQQETLKSEQANLNREIFRRTQSEVFAITRKTLADLASQQLEESMVDVFISRFTRLQTEEKQKLISPLPLLVRSTFELTPPQRIRIEQTLKTVLAKEPGELHFETSSELVSGIELSVKRKQSGLEYRGLSFFSRAQRSRGHERGCGSQGKP